MARNGRNVQTCSLCGKAGHNKRKCPFKKGFVLKTKEIKEVIESKGKKNIISKIEGKETKNRLDKRHVKKSNYIKVNVLEKTRPSPHVMDFERKEMNEYWSGIEVYKEKPLVRQVRTSVDFANLVKQANLQDSNIEEIARRLNSRPASQQVGETAEKKLVEKKKKSRIISLVKSFSFDFNLKRLVPAVTILFIFFVLPFPAVGYYRTLKNNTQIIVEKSTDAFLSLQSSTLAALGNNVPQAKYDLNVALNSFGETESILEKEYGALIYVTKLLPVVGTKISSRQDLLEAGHKMAQGNSYLVKGVDEIINNKDNEDNLSKINVLRIHLKSALPYYDDALLNLMKVDKNSLPIEYKESFEEFKILFSAFNDDIHDMVDVSELIYSILGSREFKRYLIVFQNNNEIRATGGFIGSLAVIDVQKGKILNIDLPPGGSYDLQGQLNVYLKPPLPIQLINKRWEFQDANWFPDFSVSATKLAWFYEKSRNSTVDGVIAVNATVLERLLKITGPFYNEKYDMLISYDDVLDKLQNEIEYGDEKEINQPKAILSAVLEQLINSLSSLESKSLVSLIIEFNEALNEKEVQVFFTDGSEQNRVREFGWSGEIEKLEKGQDYLFVVNSNLGGGKSDKNIEQTITHQAVIGEDGLVTDTVIIKRKHNGKKEVEDFFNQRNISYLRLYVPAGAELLEAGGFIVPDDDSFFVPPEFYLEDEYLADIEKEISFDAKTGTRITSEFGKTVFSNWIVIEPEEEQEIYFVYKLPFNVFARTNESVDWNSSLTELAVKFGISEQKKDLSNYSLYIQKQSGIDSNFVSTIIYPNDWFPLWKSNKSSQLILNGAMTEGILKRDETVGIVMNKKIN